MGERRGFRICKQIDYFVLGSESAGGVLKALGLGGVKWKFDEDWFL